MKEKITNFVVILAVFFLYFSVSISTKRFYNYDEFAYVFSITATILTVFIYAKIKKKFNL